MYATALCVFSLSLIINIIEDCCTFYLIHPNLQKNCIEAYPPNHVDEVEGLIEQLKCEVCSTNQFVIYIREIGDKRAAVEPLIKALEDETVVVRNRAAIALGIIGDERAVEPLIKALKDGRLGRNFLWRDHAGIIALGEIGDKRAVEPLIKASEDENEILRRSAAIALGKIGGKRTITKILIALIKLLVDEDEHVRKSAAIALGDIGVERAVAPLIHVFYKKREDCANGEWARVLRGLL